MLTLNQDASVRILIMLPRQMGDVLLGTPLARVLKSRFPNSKVFWCAHPLAKAVLENNPFVDEVIYLPKKWQDEVSFLSQLRKLKCDIVIDAFNNPKTALLSFLSGAKTRISFRTRWMRDLFFTYLLPREELDKEYHGLSKFCLLQPLGVTLTDFERKHICPDLFVDEKVKQKMAKYLEKEFPSTPFSKIILFGPTSRRDVRRWPYFSGLGAQIINRQGFKILWLWGPGEREYVEELHKLLEKNLPLGLLSYSSLVPLLSIAEVAGLSSLVGGWIGISNGLSHVAVAAKCKTLEIHGPTDANVWTHPDGSLHRFVQRTKGCTMCGLNKCALAKRECLEDLNLEDVYKETCRLFDWKFTDV